MNKTRRFEGIFRSGRINGRQVNDVMVRDFFRDKALETRLTRSPGKILESSSAKARSVTTPTPGKMLMFGYDAKHKDTLPYWDKFPVIIPIEIYNDGWLGLNLHYLPPVYRIRLMDALYDTLSNQKYDDSTKMKVSYSIMKNSAKMKYFAPCVKRYLATHVKSNLVEIPINEWDYTAFLPTARFVGANQRKVWDDSINGLMGK